MQDSEFDNCQECPYFIKRMQSCSLFSEGYYMPLLSNVLAFCLSKSYTNCPVFNNFCASKSLPASSAEQQGPGMHCRRRYQRIPELRQVRLFSCDQQGKLQGEFQETVWTRDLCPGGMRVVADSSIPADIWLRFQFEQDFFVPGLQGVACLCWRRPRAEQPGGVEAGLAFQDQQSMSRLCLELGYLR